MTNSGTSHKGRGAIVTPRVAICQILAKVFRISKRAFTVADLENVGSWAGRFFPVKMGVGWRRLWRLSRARCTFFFVQGGSNIIKAQRACRYDHPVAFGCRRGVDPKVGFEVYFICERLNVWSPTRQGKRIDRQIPFEW